MLPRWADAVVWRADARSLGPPVLPGGAAVPDEAQRVGAPVAGVGPGQPALKLGQGGPHRLHQGVGPGGGRAQVQAGCAARGGGEGPRMGAAYPLANCTGRGEWPRPAEGCRPTYHGVVTSGLPCGLCLWWRGPRHAGGGAGAAVRGRDDLRVIFTRRHGDMPTHAGDVVFPGGMIEPGEGLRRRPAARLGRRSAFPPTTSRSSAAWNRSHPRLGDAHRCRWWPGCGGARRLVPSRMRSRRSSSRAWRSCSTSRPAPEVWRGTRSGFTPSPRACYWGATARMVRALLAVLSRVKVRSPLLVLPAQLKRRVPSERSE